MPNVLVRAAIGFACVLGMAQLVSTARASASSPPGPDGLTVGIDSKPQADAVDPSRGITVHGSRRAAMRDPTVAYSLRLRGDAAGRVLAIGTVAPAYCTGGDIKGTDHLGSPCQRLAHDHVRNPRYPVEIEAHLYRARSASEPSRASTRLLPGGQGRATCTFDRHHCPLTISSDASLTGRSRPYLNLDVIAWSPSPDRQRGDRLDFDCFEVGRVCENDARTNGPVPGYPGQRAQQPGQLGLARFGDLYDRSGAAVSAASNRIDDPDIEVKVARAFEGATVVHSARIDDLAPGDVLRVVGSAELTGSGFDHLAGSYWVLARSPEATTARTGTPDRYLGPVNGVNCLGALGTLTDTASGYCSATRTPPTLPLEQLALGRVAPGSPSTMYLNYVVAAADGTVPPGMEPSARVDSIATTVSCYPQPRPPETPSCSVATP